MPQSHDRHRDEGTAAADPALGADAVSTEHGVGATGCIDLSVGSVQRCRCALASVVRQGATAEIGESEGTARMASRAWIAAAFFVVRSFTPQTGRALFQDFAFAAFAFRNAKQTGLVGRQIPG